MKKRVYISVSVQTWQTWFQTHVSVYAHIHISACVSSPDPHLSKVVNLQRRHDRMEGVSPSSPQRFTTLNYWLKPAIWWVWWWFIYDYIYVFWCKWFDLGDVIHLLLMLLMLNLVDPILEMSLNTYFEGWQKSRHYAIMIYPDQLFTDLGMIRKF